jgi:hypothetical protein
VKRTAGGVGRSDRRALRLPERNRPCPAARLLSRAKMPGRQAGTERLKRRVNGVCRRAGLGGEPPDLGLCGELHGHDHLEGNRPNQADLPAPKTKPASPRGDLAEDLVVAEVADADGRTVRDVGRRNGPGASATSSLGATLASSWAAGRAIPGTCCILGSAGSTVSSHRGSLRSKASGCAGDAD